MGSKRILYTIHESSSLSADLWRRFAETVTGQGQTIVSALAVLMRQYIERHERTAHDSTTHEPPS